MSNKSITVSIIIPAYNYGQFINECLESVLLQSFNNWECIVIDNGSTDNTKEVVNQYVIKDNRIKYYYTDQKGVSFARNKAVQLSSGSYIFPLDADDKIAPTCLEKVVKYIENNTNTKVVYSDAQLFGATHGKWILPPFSLKALLIENSIFCSALYRRSDFDAIGGYNENMKTGFEDWDFWIKMLKDGGQVYKIPEVLFYYRIKQGSRNSLDHESQLQLRRQIFNNHQSIYEKTFSLPELIFENYQLNTENNSLRKSKEFIVGALMLRPLRFIIKIFKR